LLVITEKWPPQVQSNPEPSIFLFSFPFSFFLSRSHDPPALARFPPA
jgi:hypothetical protein